MKQPADMDRIQRRMRPGAITRDGFLGNDPRKLIDILIDDAAEVGRLGLTHEALAARMRAFREAGRQGLGESIHVAPHFEVRVESVRGRLPCPFGHAGLLRKVNTTVRNLSLNREITYTDLGIHLIRAHGFYQGRGAPFRVAPRELAAILEIEGQADI